MTPRNLWKLAPCALSMVMLGGASASAQVQAAQPVFTLADAVRITLRLHPQLQIQQQQVELQRGLLRQAAGQFDVQLLADGVHGRAYRPLTAYEEFVYGQYPQYQGSSSATTNTSQLVVGAAKQFRNGISVSPAISATRITDNLTNRQGISQGSIQFAVSVPLLRGRGKSAVDAQEMSYAKQLEASRYEVNETISNLLSTVVLSYWNVVAAEKQVAVLRESEVRANALVENTQSLIDADRLPRTDINQVEANRAVRQTNRLAGELRLLEARQQLAVDMGLSVADVSKLPAVMTPFPKEIAPEAIEVTPERLQAYIAMALDQRPELSALKKRKEASDILARAAKNALKPQLDVKFTTGVSGLDEGSRVDQYFLSPAHSARGVDVGGGITYRFPPARDAAAGALQAATAASRQSELLYEDVARRTAAAVTPALYGFRSEAEQLKRAREAAAAYRNSLDAEREKLRLGFGSVINIITLEDRLMAVLQNEVQAELEYTQTLVRLRQATSSIITANDKGGTVDAQIFLEPPVVQNAPITTPSSIGAPR